MTPQEYLRIEDEQRRLIEAAEAVIARARRAADKAKPPPKSDLRRLTAPDVRPGLLVWHDNGDEGRFWNVVDEPLHYGDAFKAYCADDGCRCGLDGAWVLRRA